MTGIDEVEIKVKNIIREAMGVLSHSKDESEVQHTLLTLHMLLPHVKHNKDDCKHFTEAELPSAQKLFMSQHYVSVLNMLLKNMSTDLMAMIPQGQISVMVDIFFLKGSHEDALLVLVTGLANFRGYQLNKCISLIETFLREHKLMQVINRQCTQSNSRFTMEEKKWKSDPVLVQKWEELITVIASLSERVVNKIGNEASDIFFPQNYIPLLVKEMMTVLGNVFKLIKSEKESSVAFLGRLLGKLCFVGHGDTVMSLLMPRIITLMNEDYIWCRIFEKLFSVVPDRQLESVVIQVVRRAPWYETVTKLLGQEVISNKKLQYLLTNKFLLMRHFQEDVVLQNVIGHLASSASRKPLFVKVFKVLLDVWCDPSALKHTSYSQHLYITKGILVCLAFMEEREKKELKEESIMKLMAGVQCHIDNSNMRIRRLGMVVAESVTQTMDSKGHRLEFEYESDEEVEQLKKLLSKPEDPGVQILENALQEFCGLEDKITDCQSQQKERNVTEASSDLDSDDDLEPYDMSNDVKVSKVKPPLYLRDCMEGLISSDDPDKVEACLKTAAVLIRKHPSSVTEIAVEFTKILLHLQSSFAMEDFIVHRYSAMVALAVTAPVQVADYLTKEFYDRNYNLRQRMDILEVLAAAAQELSNPESKSSAKPLRHTEIVSEHQENNQDDWRAIVQKRIDSKTRRFAHGRTQPEPLATQNKFAPVAGHFFFNLLRNFDQKENTLDLLGQDHIMLARLSYTLGVIMYAATHAPIARQMAASLLQFNWALRYHPQPSVRQALLFSLSMIILSLPAHMLFSDFQSDFYETKTWLEDVVQHDADNECKKLAVQSLMLIENKLKQEFKEKADTS